MAQWLNKYILFLLFFSLSGTLVFSQEDNENSNEKDYKDSEQFEKFRRRRITIGAWQINKLKEEGALVVRLKTNKLLIDQLLKQGNNKLALEKQLEQYAINKNTMFAYKDHFKFCKLYFIYSNSSDSLLNGNRQGIFLDSNLTVDPSIIMTESFYVIAERDYAYNSSIGFVPEDSARFVKESGNPVKEMAIVVKNKFGHQLKHPFPYSVKEKNFMDVTYDLPIRTTPAAGGGVSIVFVINKVLLEGDKNTPGTKKTSPPKGKTSPGTTVKVKKQFTYEKISDAVTELNENFEEFYRSALKPDVNKLNATTKLFLY